MHTIRLLQSCEQIFRTGSLQVRVDNRDELLDIKSGKWPYDMIMQKAENLIWAIENHYTTSSLPEYPEIQRTEGLLVEIRKKLYK
ncbi:hypothetical protein ELOC111193_04230 [Elizabethkingia occulta]